MTGATRVVARLAPAAVLLALALVRAVRIPLSRDEAATQLFASLPIDQLLRAVQHVDTVVAPFYLLETLVVGLPGGGLGLRIPSVVASVAAVFAVSAVARRWWGEVPALVAGLVFATNPLVLQMATTARPYACAMLAVALAALAASSALEATGRRALLRWTGFAASVVAVGLLHLFALLAVAPLVLLTAARGRRAVASFTLALGAALVALLPFAVASTGQRAQVAWITAPDPVRAIGALANLVRSPERIGLDAADLAAGLLVVALAVAAIAATVRSLSPSSSLSPSKGTVATAPLSRSSSPTPSKGTVALARLGTAVGMSLLPWATLLAVSLTVVPVLRTAYLAPSVVGVALLVAGSAHAISTASARRPEWEAPAAGDVRRGPYRAGTSIAAASVIAIIVLALSSAVTGAAARFWQDDFPSLGAAMTAALAPGDTLVVVQHHHETGLAGGMARAVGDAGYASDTIARLLDGAQPAVEVRRVTRAGPLQTDAVPDAAAATPGRGRVFVVSTTFPFTADDRRILRERGLGCVLDRAPAEERRFGGLVLRTADCGA